MGNFGLSVAQNYGLIISGSALRIIFKLCSMIGDNKWIKVTKLVKVDKLLQRTLPKKSLPNGQLWSNCAPKLYNLCFRTQSKGFFQTLQHDGAQ